MGEGDVEVAVLAMKVGHKVLWEPELGSMDISIAWSGLFPTEISSANWRVGSHMAVCL